MSDHAAVLFANEAFYRAFADRDIAAMVDLWSHSAPIVCVHPGWGPLTTREDVIGSWRRILSSEASPLIQCRRPEAFIYGDIALVICYEQIQNNVLVATNMFRREGRQWKMVHHQAGPSAQAVPEDEGDTPPSAPRPN